MQAEIRLSVAGESGGQSKPEEATIAADFGG